MAVNDGVEYRDGNVKWETYHPAASDNGRLSIKGVHAQGLGCCGASAYIVVAWWYVCKVRRLLESVLLKSGDDDFEGKIDQ